MALAGAVFCLSGTLSKERAAISKDIANHGGQTANSVTAKVTHLICAPEEYASKTSKVVAADAKGISIVNEDFLWAAIKGGKLPLVGAYLLAGGKIKAAATPQKAKASAPHPDAPPAKKAKGAPGVAVNPKAGLAGASVLSEGGAVFDVEMVEQDVAKNMDKFYDMQVLYVECDDKYFCFQHWGRAGTSGQKKLDGPFPTADAAKKSFAQKFKDKSGYVWGSGSYSPAKAGKYTVVARAMTMDTGHKWEYYVDAPVDGKRPGWYPYDASAVANMERYCSQFKANRWLATRYVYSGTYTYKVDFAKNEQTNVDHPSHTTRKIRRARA